MNFKTSTSIALSLLLTSNWLPAAFAQEAEMNRLNTGLGVRADGTVVSVGEPSELSKKVVSDVEQLSYIDVQSKGDLLPPSVRVPEVDYVLDRVAYAEELRRNSNDGSDEIPRVYSLQDYSKLENATAVKQVPASIIKPDSRNIVIPNQSGTSTRSIYTDTDVGSLMIQEHLGGKLNFPPESSNVLVAGKPANLAVLKYATDSWVTIVSAPSLDGAIIVTSKTTKQPSDEDKDKLLALVSDLATQR